jgi:hypothetical protein
MQVTDGDAASDGCRIAGIRVIAKVRSPARRMQRRRTEVASAYLVALGRSGWRTANTGQWTLLSSLRVVLPSKM